MMIQRPQTPTWEKPNPTVPDLFQSSLSPKRWLDQDSGAVGLGIVVAIHKSNGNTAPVAITSSRPAGSCREDAGWQCNKSSLWKNEGLFSVSPPRSLEKEVLVPAYTEVDFLSHRSLCRKQMHGKDVYMYQEKAFCSTDCRSQQIISDELQEKCRRSKISKSADISCSPCSAGGLIFFTGTVAG
nr:FCS-Like Zinc finger 13 isoform X1 [Lilium hybrid division I]